LIATSDEVGKTSFSQDSAGTEAQLKTLRELRIDQINCEIAKLEESIPIAQSRSQVAKVAEQHFRLEPSSDDLKGWSLKISKES